MPRRSKSTEPITEKDLRQWRIIDAFRQHLDQMEPEGPAAASWSDRGRRLELSHYLSLFLFALVNPVLATMRALCEASKLERVQEELESGL